MTDQELDLRASNGEDAVDPMSPAGSGPDGGDRRAELRAMETLLGALEPLSPEGQRRSLEWLINILDLPVGVAQPSHPAGPAMQANSAASSVVPTPKAFMSAKKPTNAAERIAGLAFYLTHYRAQAHFKVADIVALNTESAGPKFSNPSRDFSSAEVRSGYVVAAGSTGMKQITTRGEALTEALPDREAVKLALKENEFKRRRSSSSRKATPQDDES